MWSKSSRREVVFLFDQHTVLLNLASVPYEHLLVYKVKDKEIEDCRSACLSMLVRSLQGWLWRLVQREPKGLLPGLVFWDYKVTCKVG